MASTLDNPFLPTRFEKHSRPIIWVSDRVRQLEEAENVYICGTRGSGKTSLLKALHWSERLFNSSLKDQLGNDFPVYLGVYIRVPDYLSQSIGSIDWAKIFPNAPDFSQNAFEFFSRFLELVCLEQIFEAIPVLRENAVFDYTPDVEYSTVKLIARNTDFGLIPPDDNARSRDRLSFDDLRVACRRMHSAMTKAASRGQVANFLEEVTLGHPGSLLLSVADQLKPALNKSRFDGDFSFKVCIDDCEALVPSQQVYLNTLVRATSHPIFWNLSFVDKQYESSATLTKGQDLTDADRKVIFVDSLPRAEFRQLCEKVSSLRFAFFESDINQTTEFDLARILGQTRINELLMRSANRRVGERFWGLVGRAERSPLRDVFASKSPPSKGTRVELPIYQQYLVERLFPGQPIDDVIRQQGNALGPMLRRKQVAAYLAIRSDFRLMRKGFAGWEAIIEMSDGCIRDYLEIMAEIFSLGSAESADRFVRFRERSQPISVDKQRDATEEASNKKASGYRGTFERSALRAARLVEALGNLTHRLQADANDVAVLRTPERGVFVFALDDLGDSQISQDAARRLVEDTLLRLELDGLLVQPKARNSESHSSPSVNVNARRYRLHARFAASYGFSYRGAYEDVRLPMNKVLEICRSPTTVSAEVWADEVARWIGGRAEGQEQLAL